MSAVDSNMCLLFSPFEDKYILLIIFYHSNIYREELLTKIMRDKYMGNYSLYRLLAARNVTDNYIARRNRLNTLDILR